MIMTEDKKIATRMVQEDFQRMLHGLDAEARRAGSRLIVAGEDLPDELEPYMVFTIGARDELSRAAARKRGRVWRKVLRFEEAYLHFLGYDDDPREIWEIATAAEYVRQWAKYAGIVNFDEAKALPLAPESLGFLVACGVFGEEMKRRGIEQARECGDLPPATRRN
jgi:hypothetical protein